MADPIMSSPQCPASTYRKRRNKYYAELEGVRVELQQQLDEQDPSTWDPREIQEHVRDISNFSLVIKKDAETSCFTEEDEGLIADDKDAARAGDSLSKAAGRLAQKMSDLQEATTMARELEELLVDFAKDMEEDPQLDTQQGAVPIMDLMIRFKNLLRGSSITQDHQLWHTSRELSRRLTRIHRVRPSLDAKDFRKPTTEEAFKVNKICIPKFSGGVENWLKYWGRFKSAAHDNPRMSQEVKMVYLMETITEPTATSYMTTCTLEEGGYAKAVEYLQERFDQPRELHQIHCRKIADLQPIKGIQAELVQLASTVFNAISELERQGQATANAVLMSLSFLNF